MGCASYKTQPILPTSLQDYEEIQLLEDTFLADPGAPSHIEAIRSYSAEVNFLWNTQSMRLGPLGSALVAKYPANLSGHLLLNRFYTILDEPVAQQHQEMVQKIIGHATHGRDGSVSSPFRIMSISDAYTLVKHQGNRIVGSTYTQYEDYPLLAILLVADKEDVVKSVFFEIRSYPRLKDLTNSPETAEPLDVIEALARHQDDAAQVAYATYLLRNSHSNQEQREATQKVGRDWLNHAARRQSSQMASAVNALPFYHLANYHIANRDNNISWSRVSGLLNNAIKLGLVDAEVRLARLYLAGVFGADKQHLALEQLESAVDKKNIEAASTLGSVLMDRNPTQAVAYLRQAAEWGGTGHRLHYVRAILQPHLEQQLDETGYNWALEIAKKDNQDAMLLLARIHAKGYYKDKVSLRLARRWYRRSVELAPDHGETVNEVAWVLATTNIKRLRNPSLAIKYMDELMATNPQARELPAYIDTWAAAHASKGNFERAIELQKEALAKAGNSARRDITEILSTHLKNFEANEALTEEVP